MSHWNKDVGAGVSVGAGEIVGAAVGNVGAGVGVDDALYAEAAQWEASSPTRRRQRMGGARRGRTFVAAGQPAGRAKSLALCLETARLWEIADCGSVPHDAHARALGGTSRAHWLDGISKMDGKF